MANGFPKQTGGIWSITSEPSRSIEHDTRAIELRFALRSDRCHYVSINNHLTRESCHGLGAGVIRGRGAGGHRGDGLDLGVAVAVGVAVGLALGITVGVVVGVGVGVGVGVLPIMI